MMYLKDIYIFSDIVHETAFRTVNKLQQPQRMTCLDLKSGLLIYLDFKYTCANKLKVFFLPLKNWPNKNISGIFKFRI